jgi:predicted flap endonuclease-1-like 5' DNA nuclease
LPTPPTRQAVPASQATSAPVTKAGTSQATYLAVAAAAAAAARSSTQAEARAEAKPEPKPETPAASAPAPSTGTQTYFGALAEKPSSAPKPADAPAAAPAAAGDDLTRIRAIDIEIQKRLRDIGVTTFAAIAKWSPADIARVSQTLGYAGRIEAENWIEQAQILAQGSTGIEAQRKASLAEKPKLVPQPASTFGSPFGADRLHRIIGIDGDTEKLLNAHGITKFAQIASWTGVEIEKIEEIVAKPGRVGLENWVEQAKILSRGAVNETLHETKLEDAIRSNMAKATAAAPESSSPAQAGAPREIGHLRSVKSEALRREPYATATGVFDDLKRIRGVGLLIEKKLNSLGITTYEQIANWTGADIDRISQVLDFKGRIERENWIEQARILASGGATDFSRRADRGEVETSRNQRG